MGRGHRFRLEGIFSLGERASLHWKNVDIGVSHLSRAIRPGHRAFEHYDEDFETSGALRSLRDDLLGRGRTVRALPRSRCLCISQARAYTVQQSQSCRRTLAYRAL